MILEDWIRFDLFLEYLNYYSFILWVGNEMRKNIYFHENGIFNVIIVLKDEMEFEKVCKYNPSRRWNDREKEGD